AALAGALAATPGAATPPAGLADLLARLVRPAWVERAALAALARESFTAAPQDVAAALADLGAITTRNFEPGGLPGTWIGGRGFHILVAHRLAHRLWRQGREALAMAVKTGAAASLGADIHPAARLGRGLFLDHGIGLVIGETAVIEDDCSLWHGVTLGSTLMQGGADRHPKLRRGAVIGAGAALLGPIEIGAYAVVAAGSVVLADVAPRSTVAGNPATPRRASRHPYFPTDLPEPAA
ncbi:serine O-acetyltransferase, partial [Roseomonas sp. GC11]|uniref:serine O-acetyltransferase n=1 Tax=Roseomonas sp. GC11 TaxID=2950546 RepID=UPI00210C846C